MEMKGRRRGWLKEKGDQSGGFGGIGELSSVPGLKNHDDIILLLRRQHCDLFCGWSRGRSVNLRRSGAMVRLLLFFFLDLSDRDARRKKRKNENNRESAKGI